MRMIWDYLTELIINIVNYGIFIYYNKEDNDEMI